MEKTIYGVRYLLDGTSVLKIGETARGAAIRVAEQFPHTYNRTKQYKIEFEVSAWSEVEYRMINDTEIHEQLLRDEYIQMGNETFIIDTEDALSYIHSIRNNIGLDLHRNQDFKPRPEQLEAVERTMRFFIAESSANPKFLWNAKMRFGKTFTSYQLMKRMGLQKTLILTYKPAVRGSWQNDLRTHIDFAHYEFVDHTGGKDLAEKCISENRGLVYFASFQDVLGKEEDEIKEKNKWIWGLEWDLLIIDEYHFGAWRDLPSMMVESDENYEDIDAGYIENLSIKYRLYLSGTPFRALSEGEFIEDQIFNWSYADEQNAKACWEGEERSNPYLSLPKMNIYMYGLPDIIKEAVLSVTQHERMSLNKLFETNGSKDSSVFKHEAVVSSFVQFLCGELRWETTNGSVDDTLYPFKSLLLKDAVRHSIWYLPSVGACYAMKKLLSAFSSHSFGDKTVLVVAGTEAGIGSDALSPVRKAQLNPFNSSTIILTCGKLLTGVTIPPISSILMLNDTQSPESYFQAAFRVQSPWNFEYSGDEQYSYLKKECFVFDFLPDRATKLITDYSVKLSGGAKNIIEAVQETTENMTFGTFEDGEFVSLDPQGLVDIATGGIEAGQLARRWESSKLFHLDHNVLNGIVNDSLALDLLSKIIGSRNFVSDVKRMSHLETKRSKKTSQSTVGLTSNEEKELNRKKKEVIEKLKKFVNRVPLFMYLTDFREHSLKDVILDLEPELFQVVTGLSKEDFSYLLGLGIFNEKLMNDAIYKFKRFEDASLNYINISDRQIENSGKW